jgi:hypothetical protein
MLRVRELRCRCAAVKTAIHARRGKTNPANTPIVGQSDVRGSFSIIDTQISVFNRFCVETICNA